MSATRSAFASPSSGGTGSAAEGQEIRISHSCAAFGFAILLTVAVTAVGQTPAPVVVTVQELIQRDHRVTAPAGTEVRWRDPHFERVWFPSGVDAPRGERGEVGFRALFPKPGAYQGCFTVTGGHRSDDVYPMIVIVTEP